MVGAIRCKQLHKMLHLSLVLSTKQTSNNYCKSISFPFLLQCTPWLLQCTPWLLQCTLWLLQCFLQHCSMVPLMSSVSPNCLQCLPQCLLKLHVSLYYNSYVLSHLHGQNSWRYIWLTLNCHRLLWMPGTKKNNCAKWLSSHLEWKK